jgi:hypothetical protein
VDNKTTPILAMIVGGGLIALASFMPQATSNTGTKNYLEGTVLLCVHEKQRPKINEVIAIREAPDFVKANAFIGFRVLDVDDVVAVVAAAQEAKVEPPFLAAGKVVNDQVTELIKVVPWINDMEDILK